MKRSPHRNHHLQLLRYRSQRRRRRPRIERRSIHTFDIVQIKLSDQRQIVANLLRPLRQVANILPARLHLFVVHIAQPSAEHRQPEAISHQLPPPASSCTPALLSFTILASASSQSASLANGSKPTTFCPSA